MSEATVPTRLKPGVVTGESYGTLVEACKAGGYALPAVNTTSTHTINAVLEAAATYKSDVVVQLSNGGAQFYAGRGFPDGERARILGAVSAARHVHMMAEHYGICVILHTDHANKKLIPWVEGMLGYGEVFFNETGMPQFSSHMLDLSEESLAFNLDTCARMLERMAPLGMALEIELGITGGEEDGIGSAYDDSADNSHLYTQPEEVLQAYEILDPIGMFSVAASFGNVHGVYQPGNVQLCPEILKNSQALVQQRHQTGHNPLHLVFHGGSGSEKDKIAEALRYGVFKMNIDTDTQFAFAHPIGQYVSAQPKAFQYQLDPEDGTPFKNVCDPRSWMRQAELGMIKRLGEAFHDLGSAGKTLAQAG